MTTVTRAVVSGFTYLFRPGSSPAPALLLLHGTGGDEADLLPIASALAPNAPIISPRGPVSENGMPRFFRRLSPGVFDLADLARRSADLGAFLAAARAAHNLERTPVIALGYSNGANIAASALLRRAAPESPAPLIDLAGAILLRPMVTFDPAPGSLPDLTGRRVLLLHGEADPTVPPHHRETLARAFTTAGADARSVVTGRDHALHQRDLDTAAAWLAEF